MFGKGDPASSVTCPRASQDRGEHGCVTSLAVRGVECRRPAVTVRGRVDPGDQSAAGVSEDMVIRFAGRSSSAWTDMGRPHSVPTSRSL